jgi:hypothetical protein
MTASQGRRLRTPHIFGETEGLGENAFADPIGGRPRFAIGGGDVNIAAKTDGMR